MCDTYTPIEPRAIAKSSVMYESDVEFLDTKKLPESYCCLKKNQSTPRPSEHPPVMEGKMSKRLGGIKGCKYKTTSWHLNRFPDADNIGSTV